MNKAIEVPPATFRDQGGIAGSRNMLAGKTLGKMQ
jgi:hypothetical protein